MSSILEPEVTLFSIKFSTYAQRVRISLEEKGISYKIVEVDPQNKPQELLDANPIHKKVPTLVYNGKSVAESLVILEYLEEEWPDRVPLMPKTAFEKAQVRFWTDYVYKSFEKIWLTYRSRSGAPEQQAAREDVPNALRTLETAMTSYSPEGPFFTGEKFGYLDVVLAPLGNTLMLAEKFGGLVVPGPDEIPRVHKWMDEVKARPSFSAVIPSNEETHSFVKGRLEIRSAAVASGGGNGGELCLTSDSILQNFIKLGKFVD